MERKNRSSEMSCTLCIETKMKKTKVKSFRSSHREEFCKKGVLRNFTKFTGEHLCQSLFLNKIEGLVKFLRTHFLSKHLRVASSKVQKECWINFRYFQNDIFFRRIHVLWHCNHIEYPLYRRYFLKKVVSSFEKQSAR